MVLPLVDGQDMIEQRVEIVKMREQHMHALVPSKAVFVCHGPCKTTRHNVALVHVPLCMIELEQAVRCAEAGHTRAENDDALVGRRLNRITQILGGLARARGARRACLAARLGWGCRVRSQEQHEQEKRADAQRGFARG